MSRKIFNPQSLAELTERFPPFVVRALARHKRVAGQAERGMSTEEIAERAGMPVRSVGRLASKLDWDNEKLIAIDAFCRACNFNFFRTKYQLDFLKVSLSSKSGEMFTHLSARELRIFNRKCEEWQKIKQQKST